MISPLRHTPLLPGTLENLFYPPLKSEYTYFKRAADRPFPTNDTVKAAWAADAAMLAYARYGPTRMTGAELDENFGRAGLTYKKIGGTAADWNAPGTQAIFASCANFALCAFRGTEKDDPDDIASDINIALMHERDYRTAPPDPGPSLGPLSLLKHLLTEPCLVHRGFQSALNQVWEEVHTLVTDYRQQHPQAEICFTGHSLGAALAVLAFSRFADPDLSLYTFGCPRVGDAAFRDRVLSNKGRGIYRYVNHNDSVTHVPLENFLYRQTPQECYRFNADGDLDTEDSRFQGDVDSLRAAVLGVLGNIRAGDLTVNAPAGVVDHSPARYCFRLWDCV